MESSLETIFAVFLFLIVASWSMNSIMIYLNSSTESMLRINLLEIAIGIKNKILAEKSFCNASIDPSYYNLTSKISIYIEIKVYDFKSSIEYRLLCSKGIKPIVFMDRAEAIGAYLNSSLIVVRVVVYGLP